MVATPPSEAETILTAKCHCGAVRVEVPRRLTHWQNVRRRSGGRTGVNARNFEPRDISAVRIRHLDGASSWKYLD
jgi:hypothetical protein